MKMKKIKTKYSFSFYLYNGPGVSSNIQALDGPFGLDQRIFEVKSILSNPRAEAMPYGPQA